MKKLKKSKVTKRCVSPVKIRRVGSRDVEHIYRTLGGVKKLPAAAYEGCVLVPLGLTAFIPKSAIRKFASNEAFVVEVNDLTESSLSLLGNHRRLFPFKTGYKVSTLRKKTDFYHEGGRN